MRLSSYSAPARPLSRPDRRPLLRPLRPPSLEGAHGAKGTGPHTVCIRRAPELVLHSGVSAPSWKGMEGVGMPSRTWVRERNLPMLIRLGRAALRGTGL